MDERTTYLITGGNRGIGAGLARALLLRPNNTVITTNRKGSYYDQGLTDMVPTNGSEWLKQDYNPDNDTTSEAEKLKDSLSEVGITRIDVLIANLGIGTDFHSSLATTPNSILQHLQTNTLGPIVLFQKLHPLLAVSANPKFILISSSLGSIGDMEGSIPSLAYGISKAAANYFVRKVHFEHEKIASVAIHPGWVKTANGQSFADAIGVKEPPMALEESVDGILKQIDNASKESTSGLFISYDGTIIQW